jgi:ABC-type Fe3+/spermidine/putrescine transport system ATPase subunit
LVALRVRLEKLKKNYGQTQVVKGIDLCIEEGALHFFLGPSGCGKTTTLRILAGLEKASGGKIFFNDEDVTHKAPAEREIGMVFQNYALWPHMSVQKNIEYGLQVKRLDKRTIAERLGEVLDFTQLKGYEKRLPGQLSGGQQQRVALARALAVRPKLLLLDEPLSNLDAQLRLEMRDNISRIHRESQITMVYVTHDQKEALSMGTAISVMNTGEIIQTGAPKELYFHPETAFIARFIGETNLISIDATTFGTKALGNLKVKNTLSSAQTASLRPEAFRVDFFSRGFSDNLNVFELELIRSSYQGEAEQFIFKALDGSEIKVLEFNVPEHTLKSGDKVRIGLDPKDVVLLREGL